MRSEQEMLDLIINTARDDERIRAAILNGSRANPNAPRDFFQDFDVVYLVKDIAPFKHNLEWIKRFGELMILQLPDNMVDPPPANNGFYTYLMQFIDGNRIDLGIFPLSMLDEVVKDSLSVLLLDKDGMFPQFPLANESGYLPSLPTAKDFEDCCNEFWWVSAYVAKGLWREEILYAKRMYDQCTRDQLTKMLRWYIGVETGFAINPGKLGKYFQRFLDPDLWKMLLKTYADGSYENTWDGLFTMCDLFRIIAVRVADHFGYIYNQGDDRNMTAHLRHVRALPRDAQEMY